MMLMKKNIMDWTTKKKKHTRLLVIWDGPCSAVHGQDERSSWDFGIPWDFGVHTDSGWWFQPLWNILVSWDDYSQYMEK